LAAEKNVMSKTAELLKLDVNLPLPRDYTAEHVSNLPVGRKCYAEGQKGEAVMVVADGGGVGVQS